MSCTYGSSVQASLKLKGSTWAEEKREKLSPTYLDVSYISFELLVFVGGLDGGVDFVST
jgi:hypothetical protein